VQGLSVGVVTVPGAKDPDELLQAGGAPALQAAIDAAEDLASFKTRVLLKGRTGTLASEEKARIASSVLETVRKCSDEVLRSEWMRRLAERLDVDEASLRSQLQRVPTGSPTRRPAREAIDAKANAPIPVIDADMLLCVIRNPGLAMPDPANGGAALVTENDLDDVRAQRIFLKMNEAITAVDGAGAWSARLEDALEGEDAALFRMLLLDERELEEPAKVLSELVGTRRKQRRFEELEPLVMQMIDGKISRDEEVQKEFGRLQVELRGTRKGE